MTDRTEMTEKTEMKEREPKRSLTRWCRNGSVILGVSLLCLVGIWDASRTADPLQSGGIIDLQTDLLIHVQETVNPQRENTTRGESSVPRGKSKGAERSDNEDGSDRENRSDPSENLNRQSNETTNRKTDKGETQKRDDPANRQQNQRQNGQPKQQQSGQKNQKQNGQPNQKPNPDSKPVHVHHYEPVYRTVYHEAQTHTETVQVGSDPVYETRSYLICRGCGQQNPSADHLNDHMDRGENATTYSRYEDVIVGYEPIYETRTVVDREAYQEQIQDHEVCSCGATR